VADVAEHFIDAEGPGGAPNAPGAPHDPARRRAYARPARRAGRSLGRVPVGHALLDASTGVTVRGLDGPPLTNLKDPLVGVRRSS
jgi:hypothetical protein